MVGPALHGAHHALTTGRCDSVAVYEPINRFGHAERGKELFWFYPVDGVGELAAGIAALDDERGRLPRIRSQEGANRRKLGFAPHDARVRADLVPRQQPVRWFPRATVCGARQSSAKRNETPHGAAALTAPPGSGTGGVVDRTKRGREILGRVKP